MTRWIAVFMMGVGLIMLVFGIALAYPFVRDMIEARSVSSYEFAVTPAPGSPQSAAAPAIQATPVLLSSPPVTGTVTAPPPVLLPDQGPARSQFAAPATAAPAAPPSVPKAPPPTRIVIPAIKLDAPVEPVGWTVDDSGGVQSSVWDVPNRRVAGWLNTTAPAGQVGNTVLDGHHNEYGEVFRYLVDLKPGDRIDLYAGDTVYHYMVTERHILPDKYEPISVRIANAQWIQPTNDDRLTLVTCWPYTNNTHRLIVVARPVLSSSPN